MTALRRIRTKAFGAALAVIFVVPAALHAQSSEQPVDVTAAPPAGNDTVGPAQLRNFNLGGETTRPQPSPSPVQPPQQATTEQPAATTSRPAETPRPTTSDRVASRTTGQVDGLAATPPAATPDRDGAPESRALPLDVVTANAAPDDAAAPSTPATGPQPSSLAPAGTPVWAWLAALAAALVAAGFYWWTRQERGRRQADPGRLAFAGAARNVEAGAPGAPRAAPSPPKPTSDPVEAAPVSKPKSDGLITSSALKPELEIQFVPDRLVITDREAVVQFDLKIANVGGASARNVLVEGLLVCASATQDQEIAQFFKHPRATGDRIPGIAPMDSLGLKSAVRLPLDQLKSFEAGGRTLFVPMVAFNLIHGNNNQQVSASYLVGRGKEDDEKLAPFRLDMGPRIFRGLSARPHSSGLSA